MMRDLSNIIEVLDLSSDIPKSLGNVFTRTYSKLFYIKSLFYIKKFREVDH
jgi:hypothetical protein